MTNSNDTSSAAEARPTDTARPKRRMKAILLNKYGPPENLTVAKTAIPRVGDNQLLIRVRAAGVNPLDWRIRSGSMRWLLPGRMPLTLGFDVAGEIERVGSAAESSGWTPGTKVIAFLSGRHGGGYAQYAVASPDVVAHMPAQLSYEEAASLPLAGSTALQALRDIADLRPGQQLLVNGASGGVGTFAVQLGVTMGAQVTGTCSGANTELINRLGATRAIDYRQQDVLSDSERYDVILDAVAKLSYRKARRILDTRGCYITTLPSPQTVFFQMLTRWTKRHCRFFLVRPRSEDLELLAQLADEQELRPVIEEVFPLEQAAAAHKLSESGRTRGKIVLKVPS